MEENIYDLLCKNDLEITLKGNSKSIDILVSTRPTGTPIKHIVESIQQPIVNNTPDPDFLNNIIGEVIKKVLRMKRDLFMQSKNVKL